MMLSRHRRQNCRGSSLITAALAAGVLAITVGGFLSMLSNEYLINHRSHIWNGALNLSEAGIEAGFAELNYQYYQGDAGFTTARGWTNISSGFYTKTISGFTDTTGAIIGNITVTISNTCKAGCNPLIRSVATCTTTPHGPTISRAIQSQLKSVSQWPSALLSKLWIEMNGNKIYVDSYDSTDTTKSTFTQYDVAKRQANGNIASNGSIQDTLDIGNSEIYGIGYTGPGGTLAMGPGASIGPTFISSDRATTVPAAQAEGWVKSDFNVDVPDVILPAGATTWAKAPGATGSGAGIINKDTTLNSGSYRVDGITLNSSAHGDTLTINGDVNLYVSGNVTIAGLGQLLVSSNSSLTIYIGGNVDLAGNGIINQSATPIKNKWYGLTSSTSWSVVGNGQWIGAIYAPNAAFSLRGGGASGDMSGGIVANTIRLDGQVQFHYDESLGKADTGAGYTFMSWQELRKVGTAWVP